MNVNRPNYGINQSNYTYKYLGDNNLRKSFFTCFNIMLSSCYNDDTQSSRYYNKINSDRTSAYYVHQHEIEEKLDNFLSPPVDKDTFLVGFTGIGKTTLIKNFFGIIDSNPFITDDGKLIAYLSVHADDMTNEKDVDEVFACFLQSVVNCLNQIYPFNLSNEENINELYVFIKKYKDRLVNGGTPFNEEEHSKKSILQRFLKEHSRSFYSMLIKFLIDKINATENRINTVVLLFDDIESQRIGVHIPFISKALNISACLRNVNENRSFVVKSLISLRAYTFRFHNSRQTEAKRIYREEDVILKDSIPRMKDIFEKRYQVYYDNEDVRNAIANEKRWIDSEKVLKEVVNHLADFGDIISSIAHYDISHSLKIFLRILTNKRWFAPNESYYNGSFEPITIEHYNFSIKERIFKALFYGEDEIFVDSDENILPNILSVHSEESEGNELLSLYILEYMLWLERNNQISLYGTKKIASNTLCHNLAVTLNNDVLLEKIENAVIKLYNQGYLLHSIFEPESDSKCRENNCSRDYEPTYGLYLSIRGKKILEMLENDSMLFEVFRDDIDTNLQYNTCPSTKLLQKDRLIYLISYCKQLFKIEQDYIANSDKLKYFRLFGNTFIITRLLKGIQNSVNYYYKKEDDNSIEVKKALQEIFQEMIDYRNNLCKELQNSDPSFINISFMDNSILDFEKNVSTESI